MTGTTTPGTVRPHYFRGQLLTERDFSDEQNYFREKLRRHNRLLHGWGVVYGLRVTLAAAGRAVVVSPGYALDPCGDEIILEEETLLRLPVEEPEEEDAPCPDGRWLVAIRYVEIPTEMAPALDDSGASGSVQPSRIRESCELRVLPTPPAGHEPERNRRGSGAPSICPPCPPDPDERWVLLAEIRVRGGRSKLTQLPRGKT